MTRYKMSIFIKFYLFIFSFLLIELQADIKNISYKEKIAINELSENINLLRNGLINQHNTWKLYSGKLHNNNLYDKSMSHTNDGSGSFHLKKGGNSFFADRIISEFIQVKEKKNYKVGFYMKSINWPSPNSFFIISYYDKNKKLISKERNTGLWSNSKINTWEKCSSIIEPPFKTRYLTIEIRNHKKVENLNKDIWIDDIFILEKFNIHKNIKKKPFNGSITKFDELGNIKIFSNEKWIPFFPLCIYNDHYRDMSIYSKQGFNCIAWSSNPEVINKAAVAISSFNPNGMMAALQIVRYLDPKTQYKFTKEKLISIINQIKEKNLMSHLLWYYWDNEHMYNSYNLPTEIINIIKKLDKDKDSKRMHPIYALNGQIGLARKYNNLIDITGTYLVTSREKTNEIKNLSNKFLIMNSIRSLTAPVAVAQINIGLKKYQGVGKKMRASIYKAIALGAKGIGYWRDRSPKNPRYQNTNKTMIEKYIHGDITKQTWWEDFPNIRREIDKMLLDGLIQSSHLTSWNAISTNKTIIIGTRTIDNKKYLIIANMINNKQKIEIELKNINTTLTEAFNYFSNEKISDIKLNKLKISLNKYGTIVIKLK